MAKEQQEDWIVTQKEEDDALKARKESAFMEMLFASAEPEQYKKSLAEQKQKQTETNRDKQGSNPAGKE